MHLDYGGLVIWMLIQLVCVMSRLGILKAAFVVLDYR